jgi:hypothetical protein
MQMKLGLITDIHEQVEFLRLALERFRREQVDQVVVIGDVFETGERIDETCHLLASAKAVGVWGNHDHGLCCIPPEAIRVRFSASIIGFMKSLRPRLEIDGCYFAHVEPWLDPEDISDLWFIEGRPESERRVKQIFSAVPNRLMFAGHYHSWMLVTPSGISEWRGESPIKLHPGRYFVVVGALLEGSFATFDTTTSELVPFKADALRRSDL